MTVVSIVLLGLAVAYAGSLFRLRTGFVQACRDSATDQVGTTGATVSVIIAARNEAENVVACLESIFQNNYETFEVVLVDDASEDDTVLLAQEFSRRQNVEPRLKIIELADRDQTRSTGHKKRAIEAGLHKSSGDLILMTDADSVVPVDWIRSVVASFSPGVDFVSAPVAYSEGSSVLDRSLALEMLGLVAIGGGGIAIGYPTMCNGANLAYRRGAFDRIGGFDDIDHVSSGDDALLMLKFFAANPTSVRFCADPGALVVTRPASGLRALFEQRKRWASKGLIYRDLRVVVLALLVYLFHASLLLATIAALFIPQLRLPVLLALGAKMLAEMVLLHASCEQFERSHLMHSFLPAEVMQIPYVAFVGLLGVFGSGYSWKGRELAR